MNSKQIWATSSTSTDDETIDYISLSKEYLSDALKLLRGDFYPEERDCIEAGLSENEDAMLEVDDFFTNMAKHGVSLVAVGRKSKTVCGVLFNELRQVSKIPVVTNSYETAKHVASQKFLKNVQEADGLFDIFDSCKVDCYIEVFCPSTLPKFRRRGIVSNLLKATEELCKQLAKGTNVKQPIEDNTELSLEPIPKALVAVSTTSNAKNLFNKLGWETVSNLKMSFSTDESDYFAVKLKRIETDSNTFSRL